MLSEFGQIRDDFDQRWLKFGQVWPGFDNIKAGDGIELIWPEFGQFPAEPSQFQASSAEFGPVLRQSWPSCQRQMSACC